MASTPQVATGGAAVPSATADARTAAPRRLVRAALLAVPLLALALWTAIPFLVTISVSLKTRGEVFGNFGLLPHNPTLNAYREVIADPAFRRAFLNSVVIGVGTSLLTLTLAVPAAYAFARMRFRGRHLILLFVLLPRLVPDVGTMVPLYKMAAAANLIDNPLSLIIAYSGMLLPLAVWLMAGFFQQIPVEIEESASVDGATLWQRIRYLVLPLAAPAMITVFVLAVREAWNEFTLVLVLTSSAEGRTLPYALFLMGHGGISNYPASAAFALITLVPFLLVYTRIERHVVASLTSGSSK
ncbi:MAG: ABC transporter permease subunit [Chloroflexi bacterium]|nr:ABC transporter permease subunit [Chloroflexota bacterium]